MAVLGAGRAGQALAFHFGREGAKVVVWSRHTRRARSFVRTFEGLLPFELARTPLEAVRGCQVVLICVADRAIDQVARDLATEWERARLRKPPVAFHVSGFHTERPLAALRRAGWTVGILHPIGPLATQWSMVWVRWFATRGDAQALAMARRLARPDRQELLVLRGGAREQTAYHAACSLLSNGSLALLAAAQELAKAQGPRGASALIALLGATAHGDFEDVRVRLTGPVSRGDSDVVRAHVRELKRRGDRDLLTLYRLLSRRILQQARGSGRISEQQATHTARALGGRRSTR